MSAKGLAAALLATLFLPFHLPAASAAEPAIQVQGIPDRLVLPLEEGENRILSVTLSDATPKSVWLAKAQDSRLRLYFQDAGKGQFQINLAEADVVTVLEASPGKRAFRVFAETADGKVLSSLAISYTTQTVAVEPPREKKTADPRLYVIPRDKGAEPYEAVALGWQDFAFRLPWADPAEVAALEASFESADGKPDVQATIGRKTYRFTADSTTKAHLAMTPELAAAWQAEGALWVSYHDADWRKFAVVMARPKEIHFGDANVLLFNVEQRERADLPGAGGYVKVQLGDITAGQVMVTVETDEGKTLLARTSLRVGERRTIEFGEKQYVLTLRRLVNLLIGDDWAELESSRVSVSEQDKIDALLAHVAASKDTFVREGVEHTGAEAAEHLRKKYASGGQKIETLDEFIDKIASRSSLTGKPYQVKLADGTVVEASKWLRDAAAKSKAKPAE
ncbi:MAG: DUF5329 family protein [Planctomycetia bacterium]|nr:DUF5329 family protein [Planctomycetia bacterium]